MRDGSVADHAVLVRHGRFDDVGPAAPLIERHPHLTPRRLPGRLVMPGFIDAHHHLTQSFGKSLAALRQTRLNQLVVAGGVCRARTRAKGLAAATDGSNTRDDASKAMPGRMRRTIAKPPRKRQNLAWFVGAPARGGARAARRVRTEPTWLAREIWRAWPTAGCSASRGRRT